jgi:diadenosine tetraphosphate (Ap4A) HIT family hydrolase
MTCPFCRPNLNNKDIVLENEHCLFLQREEPILKGSGLIVTRAHRETVFDISLEEWLATREMIQLAKKTIDEKYRPTGYNLGWNCGTVAGQEIFHVHLHIIPRYEDEPLAGKGIRYWLKQDVNRRNSASK